MSEFDASRRNLGQPSDELKEASFATISFESNPPKYIQQNMWSPSETTANRIPPIVIDPTELDLPLNQFESTMSAYCDRVKDLNIVSGVLFGSKPGRQFMWNVLSEDISLRDDDRDFRPYEKLNELTYELVDAVQDVLLLQASHVNPSQLVELKEDCERKNIETVFLSFLDPESSEYAVTDEPELELRSLHKDGAIIIDELVSQLKVEDFREPLSKFVQDLGALTIPELNGVAFATWESRDFSPHLSIYPLIDRAKLTAEQLSVAEEAIDSVDLDLNDSLEELSAPQSANLSFIDTRGEDLALLRSQLKQRLEDRLNKLFDLTPGEERISFLTIAEITQYQDNKLS